MHIKVQCPVRVTINGRAVTVKPHHVIEVPDRLAKTIIKKVPSIRRARLKG